MATKAKAWSGARSACTCGHNGDSALGDAAKMDHRGLCGHGPCAVPGCACGQFTWKGFLPGFDPRAEYHYRKSK